MRALILALLLALPLQARAATTVLENDDVRLEVSPENGSIIHILDKRLGTDYVRDQAQTRLFRFLLPQPDNLGRQISSTDQKVDSVEVENGILKIHFRGLRISAQRFRFGSLDDAGLKYDIGVTVTFRLDGPHVLGKLQVDNHSREEIADVTFPWLAGLTTKVGEQRAKIVIPSLSQKIIPTTADFLFLQRAKTYPAMLATSWVNYEFADRGIGIEAQSTPETQDALLALNPNAVATNDTFFGFAGNSYIAWNFYPHIAGQTQWVSPDVIIHVHGSDWHTMASEHREWYRQHFSPPFSSAFDHAIGFATYRLKRDDNSVNWTYDQIPKLADEAKSAGIHDLVIEGWREREGAGNPCPFGEIADPRLGGGTRLQTLIGSLRQQGVELAFAFHPTLLNTAAERYQKQALRWNVKSRIQGNQLSPSFIFISQDYPFESYGIHYWTEVDPASPATDFLLHEARRLQVEYGFQNLFLKGVGLQSFLSYNRDDAVVPQEVYTEGYGRFLGGLKKIFPQGMFIMEGLNDLVNPYASAGYTWAQSEGAEVLSLSIPWVPFSNDVEALDYDQANRSFARKILINLMVDGGDGTVGRYLEFARHLKSLQSLKNATTPYYAEAEFRDHEGLKTLEAGPDVIVSVFQNRSSKQTGIVFANLSNQRNKASLSVDLQAASAKGRLFRLVGRQEDVELSSPISVELEPREVAVLAIDPKP